MTDEFDDLLGPSGPPKKKTGRPTNAEVELREQAKEAALQARVDPEEVRRSSFGSPAIGDWQTALQPVTTTWLANAFRMDPATIKKRLARCKPIARGTANRPLYDFADACAHIVKPKMSPEDFVRTLNKADLPPEINLAFWNAQRAKVKFMLEAQEAWETDEVLEVFSSTFMLIKDVLTMSVEEMRERAKLTDDQAKLFEAYIDELRTQLREKLVDLPKQRKTTSLLDRPLFGASRDVPIDEEFGFEEDDT